MDRTWCLHSYRDDDSEIPTLSDVEMAGLSTSKYSVVFTLHKDTQQKECEG